MPLGGYRGAVHLQRTHLGRPCISQAEVTFSLNVVSNTHRVTSNINKKENQFFQITAKSPVLESGKWVLQTTSEVVWWPLESQLSTYCNGWNCSRGGPTVFKNRRLESVVTCSELRLDVSSKFMALNPRLHSAVDTGLYQIDDVDTCFVRPAFTLWTMAVKFIGPL